MMNECFYCKQEGNIEIRHIDLRHTKVTDEGLKWIQGVHNQSFKEFTESIKLS